MSETATTHGWSTAERIVDIVRWRPDYYTPFSFWNDQDVYLEAVVEKLSLKSLFSPICAEFCIPIANGKAGRT
jgi:hypothetical protein